MTESNKQLPSGFRIDIRGDLVKLSILKRSPRGTSYIAAQEQLSKQGKTKAEFSKDVEAAIFKMSPNYPQG